MGNNYDTHCVIVVHNSPNNPSMIKTRHKRPHRLISLPRNLKSVIIRLKMPLFHPFINNKCPNHWIILHTRYSINPTLSPACVVYSLLFLGSIQKTPVHFPNFPPVVPTAQTRGKIQILQVNVKYKDARTWLFQTHWLIGWVIKQSVSLITCLINWYINYRLLHLLSFFFLEMQSSFSILKFISTSAFLIF